MNLRERLDLCMAVGKKLLSDEPLKSQVLLEANLQNNWFDPKNTRAALDQIAMAYLDSTKLHEWVARYDVKECKPLRIGLVMAGNIPLVGFHDLLAVFISGHHAKLKLSQKDSILWPYILQLFYELDSRSIPCFELLERLNNVDAVIATGSDNSSRYFHYYFDKYPHIIRKNRVGVAILTGLETDEELEALGMDVFQYYGLGCRNVSKLWVPREFDFVRLLRVWDKYNDLKDHTSYRNNYDYNLAIYIMNGIKYMANDAILLVERDDLVSRLASIHFQYYDMVESVIEEIQSHLDKIQVIVAHRPIGDLKVLPPGTAQRPILSDYADDIDTIQFLLDL